MNANELKARIEKKQADIVKIEKRIAKWTTGMCEEAHEIAKTCKSYAEACKIARPHDFDETWFNMDWNKGPQFHEARQAYRDLEEAKATLAKYEAQLAKENNFANQGKIEAIVNFLQAWKERVTEWHIENAKTYGELLKNEDAEYQKYCEKLTEREKQMMSAWKYHYFKKSYYNLIDSLTIDCYAGNGEINQAKLSQALDKEVDAKYRMLVTRISEKCGEIQNARYLSIANNGEINGIVEGTKGKVNVQTIGAGGWNVQCFHFRVLVNEIA